MVTPPVMPITTPRKASRPARPMMKDGDAQVGDPEPGETSHQRSTHEHEGDRQWEWQMPLDIEQGGGRTHQAEQRPDREVDLPRDDDERHARGEQARDRHLSQQVRDVAGFEIVAVGLPGEENADHHQRHGERQDLVGGEGVANHSARKGRGVRAPWTCRQPPRSCCGSDRRGENALLRQGLPPGSRRAAGRHRSPAHGR